MVAKLRSNPKDLLIKYMRKLALEAPANIDNVTHEQILDLLCEFLMTDQGKLKAAYTLQENTYEKMYLPRRDSRRATGEHVTEDTTT